MSGVVVALVVGCQPQGETTSPSDESERAAVPEASEPEAASDDVVAADPGGDGGAPDVPTEAVVVDDVTLTLASDCRLTAVQADEQLAHRFVFPAECHFARDRADAIRVVTTDSGKAVIVSSSKTEGDGCDTALQIVVVAPEGPRLSKQIQHVAMCAPQQWDEMMVHVMSATRVTLGTPEASM